MSAPRKPRSEPDYTAVSVKRLHDSIYWKNVKREWLPRRAVFEVRVGPDLGFSKVWRWLEIEIESGPSHLYRYLPFLCYAYVDGRAETVAQFDRELQRHVVRVRIPIGVPVRITLVTELGDTPSRSGRGTDTRELALLYHGMSMGDPAAAPPRVPAEGPYHIDLQMGRAGEAAPAPIFVVGSYRSATSVLTWALGQHPNIWPMEETGWIAPLADAAIFGYRNAETAARGFFDVYDIGRREYYLQIGKTIDDLCRAASRRHLHDVLLARLGGKAEGFSEDFQLARSVMNPKRRWVDGTPEHSGYVTVLNAIFPNARFIGLIRNPLDVVASMLRFDRAGGEKRTVREAAETWMQMTRMVLLAYRAFGPEIVHLLDHARLVSDPEAVLAELFDFVGEPNFPAAAQTFNRRINSSQIAEDERPALLAEIDAEREVKDGLLSLHREALALREQPWKPDELAVHELRSIENLRISNIALEYRGGVPLAMTDE